jgi:peroxiredoxin
MKLRVWTAGLILLAMCGLLVGPTVPAARAVCLEVGQEAADFTISDIDGNPVTLSRLRGKVVLLAFWASWCPRCMEELTFLQGLYTEYSDQLEVLAVNQETRNLSAAHVAKLKKEIGALGIDFPIPLDKELSVWNSYCIKALPTSAILDREGIVRFVDPIYYWDNQDKIEAVLKELGIGSP